MTTHDPTMRVPSQLVPQLHQCQEVQLQAFSEIVLTLEHPQQSGQPRSLDPEITRLNQAYQEFRASGMNREFQAEEMLILLACIYTLQSLGRELADMIQVLQHWRVSP